MSVLHVWDQKKRLCFMIVLSIENTYIIYAYIHITSRLSYDMSLFSCFDSYYSKNLGKFFSARPKST